MILIDAQGISASRPGRPLFGDLSLTVATGDRVGVVGLNGGGKSTLLRVLAGAEPPETGTLRHGRDVRIAVLDQDAPVPAGTVREAIGPGWEAEAVADRLGLTPLLGRDTATLSGGQVKRVALARTLVADADLLVLDEPTNHLDIDAIAWLQERLASFRGGLVVVTHDRYLLDAATTRVLELDRGRGYLHDGGYAGYLEGRAAREEQAAAAEATRRNLARRELAWLQRGAKARTTKAKARVERAEDLISQRREGPARRSDLDLVFEGTPRLGDQVVELRGVGHGFDSGTLFAGVDLALGRRERLGIVGINGTGKTTLLDIVAGRITPREGSVRWGPTVRIGYHDQVGRRLDPDLRVRQAVAGGARDADWRDVALLERFWFDSDAQWSPIGLLSGGERRRLQLLLVLAQRPNVLLLDEPTNDLDLDTLRSLEDFLESWPGALVVVSHDRAFLERTVDDVVVLDGRGWAGRIPGGYEAWEADRRAARTRGKLRAQPGSGAAAPTQASGRSKAGRRVGSGASKPSPSTLRTRLRRVEAELAEADERRRELQDRLAGAGVGDGPGSPAGSGGSPAEISEALAEVAARIDELEHRWLELSEQLESAR